MISLKNIYYTNLLDEYISYHSRPKGAKIFNINRINAMHRILSEYTSFVVNVAHISIPRLCKRRRKEKKKKEKRRGKKGRKKRRL